MPSYPMLTPTHPTTPILTIQTAKLNQIITVKLRTFHKYLYIYILKNIMHIFMFMHKPHSYTGL